MEELLTLAKESDIDMTAEQAQDIFGQLNQKSGELADDELDNVAGGGCYNKEGILVVSPGYSCDSWVCTCGGTVDKYTEAYCPGCGAVASCEHCRYIYIQKGIWLCSNPMYKR